MSRIGSTPVTEPIAATSRSVNGPGVPRNASPLTVTARLAWSPCRTSTVFSHRSSEAPVWRSLNRMLSRARALAGTRLVASLPTSTLVTCRLVGSNHSVPSSSVVPRISANTQVSRCTGLSTRAG